MVYGWIQMVAVLFGMLMGRKIFCGQAVRRKKAEAGAGAFVVGRDGRTSQDAKTARTLENSSAVSYAENRRKNQDEIRIDGKRLDGNKYRDRRLLSAAHCFRYSLNGGWCGRSISCRRIFTRYLQPGKVYT